MPMLGKEREDTSRHQQMPSDRLDIEQLTLPIRLTLHNHKAFSTKLSPHHGARIVQQSPRG